MRTTTARLTLPVALVLALAVSPAIAQTGLAKIGDLVWNDLNANGVQDPGEPGLPNIFVNLLDCSGTPAVAQTSMSDLNGNFKFIVDPGQYMIEWIAPAGMSFSPSLVGSNPTMDSNADRYSGRTACAAVLPGIADRSWDAGMHFTTMTACHRTQTPGGWGAPANGNNPGTYRDANFGICFPDGVTIGSMSGYTATFTTAMAVENFLPDGGTPSPLDMDYVDPLTTGAGELASQTLALALNVGFDLCDPNFGRHKLPLSVLIVVGPPTNPCLGMTVQQVLDEANMVLSGGGSFSPSTINGCADVINSNFVDGTVNMGNLWKP